MSKDTQEQRAGSYGLISMMAMIVGVIIGAGIFAKNEGLIGTNGSIGSTLIAWSIAITIAITILIAFIEIISITDILHESSTFSNWGKHLFGIRFGKGVGIYMSLIFFPVLAAGLFALGGDRLIMTMDDAGWGTDTINALPRQILICAITVGMMGLIIVSNSLTVAPGKAFSNIGMFVKIVPLIFMVVLLFVMLGVGEVGFDKPTYLLSSATAADGGNSIKFGLILATVPSTLFAFDGFLFAGGLSREGKTPGTFKTAFVTSMIFVAVIYALYAIAIFGIGTVTDSSTGEILAADGTGTGEFLGTTASYGTLTNALFSAFGDGTAAKVLAPMMTFMIFISIMTAASGSFIGGQRMLTDISAAGLIADENGEYLKTNRFDIQPVAGLTVTAATFLFLIIGQSFDIILVAVDGANQGVNGITGYATDLNVVFSFSLYTSLILGALINRFTGKVESKKNIAFMPAAFIALALMIVVTIWFTVTLILPIGAADYTSSDWLSWGAKIAYSGIYVILMVIVVIKMIAQSEKLEANPEKLAKKEALIAEFEQRFA